jgi:hypothetical protein
MLQATPQFTPQQLLDAGRRAEAEGRHDLAAKFYRQLADYYAYTAEAAEARSALARLGGAVWQPASVWWHADGGPPHNEATNAAHVRSARRVKYPAPRNHYRAGRALARLFSGIGWLVFALGLALAPVAFFVPTPALFGLLGAVSASIGLALFGLVIVASGQAARALFDQANATRELVAIERARGNGGA